MLKYGGKPSKTACRGFKSFCPCQKEKAPLGAFSFCKKDLKRNTGCRNRTGARSGRNSPVDCFVVEKKVLLPLPKRESTFWCFFFLQEGLETKHRLSQPQGARSGRNSPVDCFVVEKKVLLPRSKKKSQIF